MLHRWLNDNYISDILSLYTFIKLIKILLFYLSLKLFEGCSNKNMLFVEC